MRGHPRPLAIGILGLSWRAREQQQREARIAIALRANVEGYALLETFQLTGTTGGDENVYDVVEALARRLDATAVVLRGQVDLHRVDVLAERARLTVVRL
jgi:hypothetical protein